MCSCLHLSMCLQATLQTYRIQFKWLDLNSFILLFYSLFLILQTMFSRQILQSCFSSNVIQYQNRIESILPRLENIFSVVCVWSNLLNIFVERSIPIPFQSNRCVGLPMNLFWIITKINCIYQINLSEKWREKKKK